MNNAWAAAMAFRPMRVCSHIRIHSNWELDLHIAQSPRGVPLRGRTGANTGCVT